nr:hypothetical protein B0A51_17487 [Rachicladosporium sp. CCFEE 5018]
MSTQSSIIWPKAYLPGTTDNFVANEVVVSDLTAEKIWTLLSDISKWESYYANCRSCTAPSSGPNLKKSDVFKFETFGFPLLECTVEESTAPGSSKAGRIAWSATLDTGKPEEWVGVYHAWLVEDLAGGRVRILTQESQKGEPAKQLSGVKPNMMLLGHQDWLEGLIRAARGEKLPKEETNLGKAGMLRY